MIDISTMLSSIPTNYVDYIIFGVSFFSAIIAGISYCPMVTRVMSGHFIIFILFHLPLGMLAYGWICGSVLLEGLYFYMKKSKVTKE